MNGFVEKNIPSVWKKLLITNLNFDENTFDKIKLSQRCVSSMPGFWSKKYIIVQEMLQTCSVNITNI